MKNQINVSHNDRDLKSPTILLVDDEPYVLKTLKRIFRRESYQILTAGSGQEGLDILEKQEVQLIVSDQRMPGMSGIEFLESAREINPDIVRILLTGYSDLKTAEEAINRVEIYRFLNKPWNDDDLKSTIRQGLKKLQLEQENRRLFKTIEEQNRKLKQWNEMLEQKVEERTRALQEAQSQLIQSEKMASLGILAGGVAHEINNPLGGILGIAQLLLMERPDQGRLTQDLKTIEQAALHCAEIVKNLLTFSRISDQDSREPMVIPELVDQVLLLIGHLFRQNNIEVRKEFSPDFPVLQTNRTQIQQVFINLLVNAQQAMGKGGNVFIRGRTMKNGEVLIEIQDQGCGIPESIQDKIFDPFFTTKEEGQGTGLGLSVSYRIVQEHGGRIMVDTKNGQGTSMKIIFPQTMVVSRPEGVSVQLGQAALQESYNQKNNLIAKIKNTK